jgi:hypothetical protein
VFFYSKFFVEFNDAESPKSTITSLSSPLACAFSSSLLHVIPQETFRQTSTSLEVPFVRSLNHAFHHTTVHHLLMLIASSFTAFVVEGSRLCIALLEAAISSYARVTLIGHFRMLAIHDSPSLWQLQSTLAPLQSFIIPGKTLATFAAPHHSATASVLFVGAF